MDSDTSSSQVMPSSIFAAMAGYGVSNKEKYNVQLHYKKIELDNLNLVPRSIDPSKRLNDTSLLENTPSLHSVKKSASQSFKSNRQPSSEIKASPELAKNIKNISPVGSVHNVNDVDVNVDNFQSMSDPKDKMTPLKGESEQLDYSASPY